MRFFSSIRLDSFVILAVLPFLPGFVPPALAASQKAAESAETILKETGVTGGLIVHVGCGDGKLTATLHAADHFLVHGLDRDAAKVGQARKYIQDKGLYGSISIDQLTGKRLPYIDNLVNLLVVEDSAGLAEGELMRVLAPLGVAYVWHEGKWDKHVKPWPKDIDQWTHFLHDSTNNAVSKDNRIAPLRQMQWLGSPRWARHHDHMSSLSSLVASQGRLFYIFDESPTSSIVLPSQWKLIGRDAFNGVILWKRDIKDWHTQLWPLKSGPALLTRRLVAADDQVFVTLGIDAPLSAIDAATGRTLKTFEGTAGTEEIVYRNGVIYIVVNPDPRKTWVQYDKFADIRRGVQGTQWGGGEKILMALDPTSGKILWKQSAFVSPSTLAVDDERAYFHNGLRIVALNPKDGRPLWKSDLMPIWDKIQSWYTPTLVVYEDVVLWSGGENMIPHRGGKDKMYALSTSTGKTLWSAAHAPSGYQSAEDLLVAGGLVWTGATSNGSYDGIFRGYDPHTGEMKKEFAPDVESYWFHHRCYRGKATENYLLMSRTGIEFIDIAKGSWELHHWVRGACLSGIVPCNGMIYAPPHDCACYPEAKLYGFAAMAPRSKSLETIRASGTEQPRLERGPAYEQTGNSSSTTGDSSWPTYRCDNTRSGATPMQLPPKLSANWQTKLGGQLTQVTIARGKTFVAKRDNHTLYALDTNTGKPIWNFMAGAPVDSPPTIWQDLCLFGSADGYVYCLRADDGNLVWRFRAAPIDQRHINFEQVESVWPVSGSLLVQDDTVYAVAGRSMFIDGGLHLYRLDPRTGKLLTHRNFTDIDPQTGKSLQARHQVLQMPVALPDVLASDGRRLYMRSQVMDMQGKRLSLGPNAGDAVLQTAKQRGDDVHLFAPYGFLDGSWFHRSYWVYGQSFSGGHAGYYQAAKVTPAGRILVVDKNLVYGYGRKPQYLRWTTPIEYHLFATDRQAPKLPKLQGWNQRRGRGGASMVSVEKSPSLNPVDKPLAVEARVKAAKPSGVIAARGGPLHGYSLYLQQGRPHFAVRIHEQLFVAKAEQKVVDDWVHLAGVLRGDKRLEIYINGKLSGTAETRGLLTSDPAQAMEIGMDEGSGGVGDYRGPFPFTGLIDEVRVYYGNLTAQEIQQHAEKPKDTSAANAKLVLHYTFENGKAQDLSGLNNHGKLSGVSPVKGKLGQALRFSGKAKKRQQSHFVEYLWSNESPTLYARAMLLAGKTLFVAGPADFVDEEEALNNIADPQQHKKNLEQIEALRGNRGASLLAISADDGKILDQRSLDSPPTWDSMAAADGKLVFTTMDGKVVCLKGNE
ncbi:MAG: PQQ-binding-like beta-propeller repeat protein [Pirellulales bacterium]|nr:PQQ-binding-like beta-propeller repeat protein [Pirellulales bacterium]